MARKTGGGSKPGQLVTTPTEQLGLLDIDDYILNEYDDSQPSQAVDPSQYEEYSQGVAQATPEPTVEPMPRTVEQTPQTVGQEQVQEVDPMEQQIEREAVPVNHLLDQLQASQTPDYDNAGGMIDRSLKMASAFGDNVFSEEGLKLSKPIANKPEVIPEGDESKYARRGTDDLVQLGVLDPTNGQISPQFLQVASLVVENEINNQLHQEYKPEVGEFGSTLLDDPELQSAVDSVDKAFAKSKLNKRVGNEIVRFNQRLAGAQVTQDIDPDSATVIGDMFLEAYATINPDLIIQDKATTANGNRKHVYRLTPKGEEVFSLASQERKKMFPSTNVKASKTVLPKGELVGEQRKYTKEVTGKKGDVDLGIIKEAMYNLHTVAHSVLPRREKILYATAIAGFMQADTTDISARMDIQDPQAPQNPNAEVHKVYAKIHNFGEDKYLSMKARQQMLQDEGDQSYDPDRNYTELKRTKATELRSIAEHAQGANHFTFNMQGFQGRIQSQQTAFNPTSSKMVRFVTGSPHIAKVSSGSRLEKALMQMYAMSLVPDADAALPNQRIKMLRQAQVELDQMGKRLKELLESSITDDQLSAVRDAIKQGIPLNSPDFPQVQALALDPNNPLDAKILKNIEKKGEDGPHYIDGLIDFHNYVESVIRKGGTHHTQYNIYIDGKTNGIASNGIMMGDKELAYLTGVIRKQYDTLLDVGDVRDELASNLLADDLQDKLEAVLNDFGVPLGDMMRGLNKGYAYTLASTVFNYRQLNKDTTMTFSYGKDIASFHKEILQAMYLKYQEADATYSELNAKRNRGETLTEDERLLGNNAIQYKQAFEYYQSLEEQPKGLTGIELMSLVLLEPYKQGIVEVLGDRGIRSNRIMKGAAGLAALGDELLTITGPTGMDLHFGGAVSEIYDELTPIPYSIAGKRKEAYTYNIKKYSASAVYTTKDNRKQYARKAMNGAQVGAVQAVDAATVAKTFSGRSWDKLTEASNGNPYSYPIYDAFKLDVYGYDTMLEEVNNNWFYTALNYNYIAEAKKASESTMRRLADSLVELRKAGDNALDTGPNSRFAMLGDMLTVVPESERGPMRIPNLTSFFYQTLDFEPTISTDDRRDIAEQHAMKVWEATAHIRTGVYWPTQLKPSQILHIIQNITQELNLKARMDTMIDEINKGKLELEKDYNKKIRYNKEYLEGAGFDTSRPAFPLQYYAH